MELSDLAGLARPDGDRIFLLVLDGLGGLPLEPDGPTELEAARTPHLDALAAGGDTGVHVPVAAGITPGSGPGHLSLFGYDPLRYRIGRGVLEALGVEFPLEEGDVAARGNLCTVDGRGRILDRRAGRIPTSEAKPICELLSRIEVDGAKIFVRPVKEHRFLLVVRTEENTTAAIGDTDPEAEGVPPKDVEARDPAARPAARAVREWLARVPEILADQPRANMVLLRGFSMMPQWPRFPDVFRLRSVAVAAYPMYRGVARLVGMDAVTVDDSLEALATAVEERAADADFLFAHVKGTDKAGEDGDFARKVQVIEEVDRIVPRLREAVPGIWIVTGDHSTPARLRSHSWHPVPFLISGGAGRGTPGDPIPGFGETACRAGSLGRIRGWELMPLAVARAGRLTKYGA